MEEFDVRVTIKVAGHEFSLVVAKAELAGFEDKIAERLVGQELDAQVVFEKTGI